MNEIGLGGEVKNQRYVLPCAAVHIYVLICCV